MREEFFAGDVLDRDLVDYIRSLRARYKTGLLSNAWPDTRDYLVRNRVEDAFDVLVISAEVGIMKPERGIFELTLRQLGVAAQEAAFIDDTSINVEAAGQMGLHGILFRNRRQVQNELQALLL